MFGRLIRLFDIFGAVPDVWAKSVAENINRFDYLRKRKQLRKKIKIVVIVSYCCILRF